LKVDFIILGAQKCGTTTLARILEQHEQISFCSKKEPNFWCSTNNWKDDIAAYHDRFPKKENVLYGEASTSYTFLPLYNKYGKSQLSLSNKWGSFTVNKLPFKVTNINIPEDLYEYNPKMKFIYIVRNPYDRIKSAYKHFYHRAYIYKKINDAIPSESVLIDITRYYTQMKPYIEKFGRENILILNFEDLKSNQQKIRQHLTEFLNIEDKSFNSLGDIHSNKSSVFRPPYYLDKVPFRIRKVISNILNRQNVVADPLSYESKKLINYMLKYEVDEISNLMDQDLSHWLT